jgi:hypothetical protein
MPEFTIRKAEARRSVMMDGVGFIGKLAGAAAILKMLGDAFRLSLADWLRAVLDGYARLFHPIVDYTIGLVPRLFGWELLPWAKDLIVLYAVFAAALGRVAVANVRRYDGDSADLLDRDHVIALAYNMAIWPVIMRSQVRIKKKMAAFEKQYPDRIQELPDWYLTDVEKAKLNVRQYKVELLTIIAIVVLAILFSLAGKL